MSANVLLVEDEPTIADLIRLLCERQGYRVIIAANGQEALNILTMRQVGIVLMDVKMPVMDGIEATKRIRATRAIAHLPIVFITAMASTQQQATQQQAELLALRPHAIFIKPFEYRAFIACIEQIVKEKENVGAL